MFGGYDGAGGTISSLPLDPVEARGVQKPDRVRNAGY
jgi:hypothetical protein